MCQRPHLSDVLSDHLPDRGRRDQQGCRRLCLQQPGLPLHHRLPERRLLYAGKPLTELRVVPIEEPWRDEMPLLALQQVAGVSTRAIVSEWLRLRKGPGSSALGLQMPPHRTNGRSSQHVPDRHPAFDQKSQFLVRERKRGCSPSNNHAFCHACSKASSRVRRGFSLGSLPGRAQAIGAAAAMATARTGSGAGRHGGWPPGPQPRSARGSTTWPPRSARSARCIRALRRVPTRCSEATLPSHHV